MLSKENLEYPNCPLCSNDKHSSPRYVFFSYGIVKCLSCGLNYLYPRLTEQEIQKLYADDSYYVGNGTGYSEYASQERALKATFRKLLRNLNKENVKGLSLLDVGCGYGFLLSEAKPYFKYRVGVDISSEAVKLASRHAEKVFRGGIETILSTEQFDCIICNQVIEHVYEPLAFIEKLKAHLNKSGNIVLSTPWMNGPLSKLMGKRWPSFKIPEHVAYYDEMSLGRLMKQAKLRNVRKIPYPHAFPLSLIAEKFRVNISGFWGRWNIWVPGTTIAMVGNM